MNAKALVPRRVESGPNATFTDPKTGAAMPDKREQPPDSPWAVPHLTMQLFVVFLGLMSAGIIALVTAVIGQGNTLGRVLTKMEAYEKAQTSIATQQKADEGQWQGTVQEVTILKTQAEDRRAQR